MKTNSSPIIILVEPQLAVNVGMIARTMLNFGFEKLRIVNPRDINILNNAIAASAGADLVLERCEIFASLSEAVKDLSLIYATTKRTRCLVKPTINLYNFIDYYNFMQKNISTKKIGFLFGKESSGLSNNDLNYANILLNIHTNSNFSSLSIVQAVALVCYEYRKTLKECGDYLFNESNKNSLGFFTNNEQELATFADLNSFFLYLENFLNKKKFYPKEKKDFMIQNFRNIFLRNNLTKSEIKSLFKVIKALCN